MSEWTSNKGEWSEAYVLLKLLVDPVIAASDALLRPVSGKFYVVKEVIWEGGDITRRLTPKSESYVNPDNASGFVTLDEIRSALPGILDRIKNSSGAFTVPVIQDFYLRMGLPSFKMSSTQKIDIKLVLPSLGGGQERELGFSVKSQLGNPSTLLNASAQTNIGYFLVGDQLLEQFGESGTGHYRTNLDLVKETGGSLEFSHFKSPVFASNLRNFSSDLPEFFSEIIRTRVTGESTTRDVKDLVTVSSNNELDHPQRIFQIKSLLRAIALGLVPSKSWSGKLEGYGGYIVVKKSGELVCLHLDNDDDFKDYLFENTYIDIPKNDLFEEPETIDGKRVMYLNSQIRFKS